MEIKEIQNKAEEIAKADLPNIFINVLLNYKKDVTSSTGYYLERAHLDKCVEDMIWFNNFNVTVEEIKTYAFAVNQYTKVKCQLHHFHKMLRLTGYVLGHKKAYYASIVTSLESELFYLDQKKWAAKPHAAKLTKKQLGNLIRPYLYFI